MKKTIAALTILGAFALASAAQALAQQASPAPQAPAGRGAPAPGGRGGGGPQATFPAQQRPPGDPALIARGNTIYGISCRSCHGADLRGGDLGGPNLLRSQVVLEDQFGELMAPIIQGARRDQGMPAISLAPDDVKAVAEYVHSIVATARGQGAPPPGPPVVLNVLVGDPAAGQAYFGAHCSSCHSPAGDLQGIGSRIPDAAQLQNTWVGGGGGRGGGGRGGPEGASPRETTVTVTQTSGQKAEGRLVRIDDFIVILAQADGSQRSFRRDGDVPKVEVHDPMEGHRKLLPVYTDKDIHDVTAYLTRLK